MLPPPIVDWLGFYAKKLALLGRKVTLFSLLEVFCGPQICQKCVGGRGSAQNPAGGAHDAPPTPWSVWEGNPLPIPAPLVASILAPIGAQLLCPNVKSWLSMSTSEDGLRSSKTEGGKHAATSLVASWVEYRPKFASGNCYSRHEVSSRSWKMSVSEVGLQTRNHFQLKLVMS